RLQGDWSSDVCSSDLSDLGADLVLTGSYVSGRLPESLELQIAIQDARSAMTVARVKDIGDESNLPAFFAHTGKLVRNELGLAKKIGRASCRERVEVGS